MERANPETENDFADFMSWLSDVALVHLRNVLDHMEEMGIAGDESTDEAYQFLKNFEGQGGKKWTLSSQGLNKGAPLDGSTAN